MTDAEAAADGYENNADEPARPLPTGSGFVCFDATPLFKFREHGALDRLGSWFPRAFTADVISKEEVGGDEVLARYPHNQEILDASFLESVEVNDESGLRLVSFLRERRWASADLRDRGEAEVLALCKRYGWTAITNDKNAIEAGGEPGITVPCVHTLTLVAAATAFRHLDPKDGWRLHVALHRQQEDADITTQDVHRATFDECVTAFHRIRTKEALGWPQFLAHPRLVQTIRFVRDHGLPPTRHR